MEKIEYRVRPVMRYIVTRWAGSDDQQQGSACSQVKGEYDNAEMAYNVGYALCKQEHEALGYPIGDTRIMYPEPVKSGAIIGGMSLNKS